MSNELKKAAFDYALVTGEQAEMLRAIAAALRNDAAAVETHMMSMGEWLTKARDTMRADGVLFEAWCNSSECPVSLRTAQRLMTVHKEFGKNAPGGVLPAQNVGFRVLSTIAETKDAEVKAKLAEGVDENTTKREIEELKKRLLQEKRKATELAETVKRKDAKLRQSVEDMMATDRAKREVKKQADHDLANMQERMREREAELARMYENKKPTDKEERERLELEQKIRQLQKDSEKAERDKKKKEKEAELAAEKAMYAWRDLELKRKQAASADDAVYNMTRQTMEAYKCAALMMSALKKESIKAQWHKDLTEAKGYLAEMIDMVQDTLEAQVYD